MSMSLNAVIWSAGLVFLGPTAHASDGAGDAKPDVPEILREAITAHASDRPWEPYLLHSIAVAFAEAGRFEEALSAAGQLSNVGWKDSALSSIALAQIHAGDVPAARRTLAAMSVTQGESTKDREIAVFQAKSGEFTAAIRTAETGTDSAARPWLLARILKIQAESGDFQAALHRAEGIPDLSTRETALAALAGVRAEAGEVPEALRMAERLTGVAEKVEALRFIIEARRKAGDFAEAVRLGNRALAIQKGGINKALIRLGLVRDHLKTGDFAAALKAAEPVWEKQALSNMGSQASVPVVNDLRVQAFVEIAEAQGKAGRVKEALQTAEALREPEAKVILLTSLAVVRARAGDRATARSILPNLEAIDFKKPPINIVVGVYSGINLWTEVARAQALIGDTVASRASFLRIVKLPAASASQGSVPRTQAQAGDIEGALQTAEAIRDEAPKSQALQSIALVQVKAGDLKGALRTARTIPSSSVKSVALARIGEAQAQAADPATPATFRDANESASGRGDLLAGIAKLQARSGNAQEALGSARAQRVPETKAWALLGVAQGILARDRPLDPNEQGPTP